MPGKPLPDAEQLLQALIEQMRPAVGPETGLIGIHTGGVWVAERLHSALKLKIPLAALDVSFYRDDYESRGLKSDVKRSDIPFEVEDRHLVLVDDVLYTGRTIRAADIEFLHAAEAPVEESGERLPSLREAERAHIVRILDACSWNKKEAARILEISRGTLYRKILEFGLEPQAHASQSRNRPRRLNAS